MRLQPFAVERWFNQYAFKVTYNVAESCVRPLRVEELLAVGAGPEPGRVRLLLCPRTSSCTRCRGPRVPGSSTGACGRRTAGARIWPTCVAVDQAYLQELAALCSAGTGAPCSTPMRSTAVCPWTPPQESVVGFVRYAAGLASREFGRRLGKSMTPW